MKEKILAWHFLPDDRRLQYPPHTLVVAGQTIAATGKIKLHANGLHGSIRPMDALGYAPGSVIERVEHSGAIIVGHDKVVSSERKCLAIADASRVLFEFACQCAERALTQEREAGREPHKDSWKAIQARRDWLVGKISDEELKAAQSAALNVALSAADSTAFNSAFSAAHRAAQNAVFSAASSAAFSAAHRAAWSAADSAAGSAAESSLRRAEREWQNDLLEKMLTELLERETVAA
jgi:hypothetical protein